MAAGKVLSEGEVEEIQGSVKRLVVSVEVRHGYAEAAEGYAPRKLISVPERDVAQCISQWSTSWLPEEREQVIGSRRIVVQIDIE